MIQTTSPASDSTDADKTSSGNGPTAIQQLQQKVKQHETQLQALQASVPQGASKNDTRAGYTATPQPAGKTKDVGTRGNARTKQRTPPPSQTRRQPYSRRRRSGLDSNTHGRLRRTTQAETGRQRTNNNVVDNTAPNDRKTGPKPTDDSAPQPPDVKRRQNNAQRHWHSNQRGLGGGPGRGWERGY